MTYSKIIGYCWVILHKAVRWIRFSNPPKTEL
jgi:hypothetical protein